MILQAVANEKIIIIKKIELVIHGSTAQLTFTFCPLSLCKHSDCKAGLCPSCCCFYLQLCLDIGLITYDFVIP